MRQSKSQMKRVRSSLDVEEGEEGVAARAVGEGEGVEGGVLVPYCLLVEGGRYWGSEVG